MDSLLNHSRPPVFCPGCAHERVVKTLDAALSRLGMSGDRVGVVSDIGCSGLFDTFFHTHAMHGLHGRALTYATGIKLACPDLTVVVTMGDGGQGIGGAHLLAACRRNVDLTLLVLNNFNFGMTGGQFSATTPPEAVVGSGFLNRLEQPMDVCRVAAAAGAPYAVRCSTYQPDLADAIARAVRFEGFAVVDIWGICPGRYTRENRLTPAMIEAAMSRLAPARGAVSENARPEYGRRYREEAAGQPAAARPRGIPLTRVPPQRVRQEIVILGSAGQRIVTAGEILCLSGMAAGMQATQKNEYNITVLRGPSISEVMVSPDTVGYTGIRRPSVVLALADEGVARRPRLFEALAPDALVIRAAGIQTPSCPAAVRTIDFKAMGLRSQDWALGALTVLADHRRGLTPEMLDDALAHRFEEPVLAKARRIVQTVREAAASVE